MVEAVGHHPHQEQVIRMQIHFAREASVRSRKPLSFVKRGNSSVAEILHGIQDGFVAEDCTSSIHIMKERHEALANVKSASVRIGNSVYVRVRVPVYEVLLPSRLDVKSKSNLLKGYVHKSISDNR